MSYSIISRAACGAAWGIGQVPDHTKQIRNWF